MFTVIENRVGHVGTDQVALILIMWRRYKHADWKDADWSKRKARVESKVQIKISLPGWSHSISENCLWLHSWFLLPTPDFCLDDGHVSQLLHHTTCNLSASWSMATRTGIFSKPRGCDHFWSPGQFSAYHCSVSDNSHGILYHQYSYLTNDSSPSRRIWKSPNLVVFGDHHAASTCSLLLLCQRQVRRRWRILDRCYSPSK